MFAHPFEQGGIAATVQMQVEQHAPPFGRDGREGGVDLGRAVAGQGLEHVGRAGRGLHAGEHGLGAAEIAPNQREVQPTAGGAVDAGTELAVVGRGDHRVDLALHQTLVREPPANEVGNRHDADVVGLAKALELRQAGHGAVRVHDLADHAARREAGEPREVHAALGLAGAHEHAAIARAQRNT